MTKFGFFSIQGKVIAPPPDKSSPDFQRDVSPPFALPLEQRFNPNPLGGERRINFRPLLIAGKLLK